jgi:hypothetical protein
MEKKKRYWYECKVKYLVNGVLIFSYITQIGLLEQKGVLNRRYMKKSDSPLHLNKKIDKKHLKNGAIDLEVICFLGYFKN